MRRAPNPTTLLATLPALAALLLSLGAPACLALANDTARPRDPEWPMWGGDPSRNMAGVANDLPDTFDPGEVGPDEQVDLATTENVRWVAKLGSQTYGNPTVVGGRVFVGTNNQGRGDPRFRGDYGLVVCLDAKTGEKLWTFTVPKLGSGKVGDWEFLGICSSPAVIGDRAYVVTNRCEVVALDVDGLSDGNQGYESEGQYMSFQGIRPQPPVEVKETDADIVWRYDIRMELGVYPHNITSSSVLVVGDRIYASTSNGVTYDHLGIPSPKAPTLIALDRKVAEKEGAGPDDILIGEEASGLSKRILHCNWTSPTYGEVGGEGILIFGGPDGFCYGFDPVPVKDEEGFGILKELWRYDCNLPEYRYEDGDESKPRKYATARGPSEVIATPVFHDGRVYVSIGQDPEHGEGVGNFSCIDAKTGAKVWDYPIHRSISTCSVADGLVYVADYSGFLYCFDAKTGKLYWKHDTVAAIWGSTLFADGKVYLGNEDGILTVFHTVPMKKLADELGAPLEVEFRRGKLIATAAGGEKKELTGDAIGKYFHEIDFGAAIYLTPIVADDVLYVGTMTHLYAIASEPRDGGASGGARGE